MLQLSLDPFLQMQVVTDQFGIERTARATSRSIVDLFLLVLACLVPLDVAVRRLQPDWALIKGWFGLGGKIGATRTLGALLRRKQQIEFIPGEKEGREDRSRSASIFPPRRPISKPAASRPVGKPQPDQPTEPLEKPEVPKDGEEPSSTTGRLLARKKKWRKE